MNWRRATALGVVLAAMIITAGGGRPALAAGADAAGHDDAVQTPAHRCAPIYEPKTRRLAATAPVGKDCRKTGLYHLLVSEAADCGRASDGRPLMRFGYLDAAGEFRPAFAGCFRRFEEAHRQAAAQSAGGTIDDRRPFWIE